MANALTYGILSNGWTIKDYLLKFVNIEEPKVFLESIDEQLRVCSVIYDKDIGKAKNEYLNFLDESSKSLFNKEELERKRKNFPKCIREWEIHRAKTETDLRKYLQMSNALVDLGLVENKNLQDEMLEQIKQAIQFDCKFSERPKNVDNYDIDEYISWKSNHLWRTMRNITTRYNNDRAKLLKRKYKAIELLEVFAKL